LEAEAMSGIEEYEWMLQYLKTLDPVNARIIEGLGQHNPRNLSLLSKKIGLPPTTVAFRVKKLMKEGFLQFRAKLNSSKLGLIKAVLIADSNHRFSETLLDVIENTGYWTYTARCYGKFNGFYAVFSFPFDHKTALKDYLDRAKQLGAISTYSLYWTTNIFEVAPNFGWFNFKTKTWNFPWQKWINEVLKAPGQIAQNLKDPQSYKAEIDGTDLLILKELEKNGLADFTELSKVAKMTPQAVRHRFLQHIMKRKLLAEYEVAILPYPLQVSDMCAFVFDFATEHDLAKFDNSLRDKPFALNHAKVVGKNSLLVHSYLPKTEFSNFMMALNHLTREDIIQDFSYVSLDVPSFKRQTVSYEYFHDGKWVYDFGDQIEKLTKIVPLKVGAHSRSS